MPDGPLHAIETLSPAFFGAPPSAGWLVMLIAPLMSIEFDSADSVAGWAASASYTFRLTPVPSIFGRMLKLIGNWLAAIGEENLLNGNLAAALTAYQRATELAPNDATYWRMLAMFCADNGVQVLDIGLPAAKKAAEKKKSETKRAEKKMTQKKAVETKP